MPNRIREIRKQKGMTLLQVADKLGVSESTVQRYESGNIKNLKYETMVSLAKIFETNPAYLMGWEQEYPINHMTPISEVLKIAEIENKTPSEILGFDVQPEDYEGEGIIRVYEVHRRSDIRNGILKNESHTSIFDLFGNIRPIQKQLLPVLGSVAAGKPILMEEQREVYVETPIKADFILIVKGDSMTGARINDGDIVFIRQQPIVENGEIAVVAIDDEATLKRFYKYGEELIVLRSENPNYADMEFRPEDGKEIHVLGKAVAFQSDVR